MGIQNAQTGNFLTSLRAEYSAREDRQVGRPLLQLRHCVRRILIAARNDWKLVGAAHLTQPAEDLVAAAKRFLEVRNLILSCGFRLSWERAW